MKTAIYVLYDPRECRVRYVGKSIDPHRRLRSHRSLKRTRFTMVDRWIDDMRKDGIAPRMRVVGWVDDWQSAEKYLIARCRESGRNIFNIEDGGLSGKTSQKRLSNAWVVYRKLMATLSRHINAVEASGGSDRLVYMKSKQRLIRQRVMAMQKISPDLVEDFYKRIEARFSPQAALLGG